MFLPDEQEVCSTQQLSGEQHVSTITPQFSPTPAGSRNIWKEMDFNTEATKAS